MSKNQFDFTLITDSTEDTFGHKVVSNRVFLKLNGKKLGRVKRLAISADAANPVPAIAIQFSKPRLVASDETDPMLLLMAAFKGLGFIEITEE